MKGKDFVFNVERQIKVLGMRKDEFYKKVGITASAFSLYRSEKSFPSKDTLERTANVLGVSVASLLEPPPETKKAPTPEGERQSSFADEVTRFLLTLPKDRLRGILLALGAPEELLSELDRQE